MIIVYLMSSLAEGAKSADPPVAHVVEMTSESVPVPRYFGQWESGLTAGEVVGAPGWSTVDDALRWARARAPVVILRTGTGTEQNRIWSAGEQRVHKYGDERLDLWQDSESFAAKTRDTDYRGTVFLTENFPIEYSPTGEYAVVVSRNETLPDPIGNPAAIFADLHTAVDFARSKARIVIIRLGAPPFELLSAGAESPEQAMPRWADPRASEDGWGAQ